MLSLFILQSRSVNCDIHKCLFGLEDSAVSFDFNVKGSLDAVKLLIVSLKCIKLIAHPLDFSIMICEAILMLCLSSQTKKTKIYLKR
jgi:hypothetical protein